MEATPTIEDYLQEQEKYLRRKYPFFGVRLKPCIVMDPSFLVMEPPKPLNIVKERPVF